MSLYVNRIRYKGGSPTLGASSGIINNAVINGHDLYDDDYDPTPPAHDYSLDYFTIESLEDGNTISFVNNNGSTPNKRLLFKYETSTDWLRFYNTLDGYSRPRTITLNKNEKIIIKGNQTQISTAYNSYNKFSTTKTVNVYGNIMSLLYDDNFIGQTALPSGATYTFAYVFKDTKIVDASNLMLPATTLVTAAYSHLFDNCTLLTKAPKLTNTVLVTYCYNYMFYGCTSLTKAPDLLFEIFDGGCVQEMFRGCSSLNYIKCLATSRINAGGCMWVQGVSSTGTFYKAPSMTSWSTGSSGIPTGWTVVDYVE